MTKAELITKYNKQIGNIVPNIGGAIIEICSLQDVIDNTKEFSFKANLFPVEMLEGLLDFTDTTYTAKLDELESNLVGKMRWIAFYPKVNVTFEKKIHAPILNLNSISASDSVKTAFQIPIEVTFYTLFNGTSGTIKRYYNSNIYWDHTGYNLIPTCIVSNYNFNDLFQQSADSTVPYSDASIQNNGIDFTYMNNFSFIIDDVDIYAERKNIVFIEVKLNSAIQNFDLYVMMKDGSNVYLKKAKSGNLKYRKVFYNADFLNIKNRIVKYSA